MATVSEVVCKVLKLECEPANLNYFSMLKLSLETSDESEIRNAIQVATASLQVASKNEQPAAIEIVKKLLQQASATLLNAEKRAAYLSQIRRPTPKVQNADIAAVPVQQTPNQPATSEIIVPRDKADRQAASFRAMYPDPLVDYLPSGDPHAEFSLRDYLSTAPIAPTLESVASRLADLEAIRKGLTPSSVLNASAQSNNSLQNSQSNRGSLSIQERIHRKRRMQNTLLVGGLTILSICLVAFAVFQFLVKSKDKSVVDGASRNRPVQAADNDRKMDDNLNMDGDKPRMGEGNPSRNQVSSDLPSVTERFGEGTQSFFSDQTGDTSGANGTQIGEMADAPMDGMRTDNSDSTGQPADAMEDGFDKAAWDRLVSETRESIAAKDFDRFSDRINTLFAIETKNQKNLDLRQALDRTGQVYQIGSEAFESTIAGLESGVALNTSSDIISFVENKGDKIIFRIRGMNETFAVSALPVDILQAVLEFGLGTENAVDVASQGVFMKLYNSDPEYQKRGDELLKQAADLDSKFASLDDFSHEAYHVK